MALVPSPPTAPFMFGPDLSTAQRLAAALACRAHSKMLPSSYRQGFLLCDGTGVGKSRTCRGIVMASQEQRHIWVTTSPLLFDAVKNEFGATVSVVTDFARLEKTSDCVFVCTYKGLLSKKRNRYVYQDLSVAPF